MTALQLPTGRRGQLAAAGIAVLVFAALWFGAADPLIGWYGDRASELAQRDALLRRMADVVATLPALRRQATAGPATGAAQPNALLEGASDATAGASLQQLVQDMATHAGVTVSTIETLPARPTGGLRRIALRVTATAPWPPLVHLLASIEQAAPRMSIDELQLRTGTNLVHLQGLPINASFSVIAFRSGDAP